MAAAERSKRSGESREHRRFGSKIPAQVEIVHLEQPLPELLRRNQQRDTTLSNAKLMKMLTRWEAPLPTEAHEVVFWEGE